MTRDGRTVTAGVGRWVGRGWGRLRRARRGAAKAFVAPLETLEDRTLMSVGVTATTDAPIITEFLAINNSGLRDQDGQRSDWIELYNPTAGDVNLGGYYLTDDAAVLAKWRLPAVTLPSGSYLTVFASGKDRAVAGQELHTNFTLDGAGEYLGLIGP